MNCKTIAQKLTRGAELTAAENAHLDGCKSCAATCEEQRLVSRSLKMLAAAEPPIGSADRAFRAAMAGESAIAAPSFLERLLPIATPFAAGAAAAAAFALFIGAPSGPGLQPDSDPDVIASGLLDEGEDEDYAAGALLALGDDQ